jgi:hypothetical protein
MDYPTLGESTSWHCSTCGACGGPVHEVRFRREPSAVGIKLTAVSREPETEPSRAPFLAGHALDLPPDCLAAQAVIWQYVEDQTDRAMKLLPVHAGVVRAALYLTPDKTDLTSLVELLLNFRDLSHCAVPSLRDLVRKLTAAGFNSEHPEPTESESLAGEVLICLYQRQRTDPEDGPHLRELIDKGLVEQRLALTRKGLLEVHAVLQKSRERPRPSATGENR